MITDPNQLTVVAVLLAIAAAGLKRYWVWGWTYLDKVEDLATMTADRNFWRDAALKAMGHTDKALEISEKRA